MNRDNSGNSIDLILVGKCPVCLLSDYRKEEIIRSMNLINGFGARSYSIRGIYISYPLRTVHHKLHLRKAIGVPRF